MCKEHQLGKALTSPGEQGFGCEGMKEVLHNKVQRKGWFLPKIALL